MLKCIAIDDEPLALGQIKSYIERIPFLELVNACQSAVEAMECVSKGNIDLMFVDINMPDLNGLDFVKSLNPCPMVVFTTAYSEYAIEGFKVDAIDYLLKPFGYADLLKAANKALKQSGTMKAEPDSDIREDGDYIFVKADYKIVRIRIKDIKYVESMSEYVRIYVEGEPKPVITLLTMRKLEDALPEKEFMRVHRSYIVNLSKITEISRMRIIFDKDVYIPVGDLYKDKFNEYVERFYIGKD